jgi:mono/diheme cytochrome c family protein
MQHIKQLQIALGILTLGLMLLVGTCIIFVFTYTPEAPVVKNENPNPNTPAPTQAPALDAVALQGQSLFNNNCAACHAVSAEVVVGPGLKGITQRRPEPWLVSWIKNSQKVVASGDQYAVELYNKFNKTPMPAFDSFTDDEMKALLKYIDVAGK